MQKPTTDRAELIPDLAERTVSSVAVAVLSRDPLRIAKSPWNMNLWPPPLPNSRAAVPCEGEAPRINHSRQRSTKERARPEAGGEGSQCSKCRLNSRQAGSPLSQSYS